MESTTLMNPAALASPNNTSPFKNTSMASKVKGIFALQ
jgi:hypothetical protein